MVASQDYTSIGDHRDPIISETGKMENEETEKDNESSKVLENSAPDVKLFKRRWLQLALFVACSIAHHVHWYQYTICSNIVQKYWGVSSFAIESTSMVYMLVYITTVFPATHLMERVGLRWTGLIVAGGTCAGAWIKVFSVSPDRFAVTLIGQTLIACSQVFVSSFPGRLAAYWFGPNEVATATSIACYGLQIGISICFATMNLFVRNHDDIVDIGDDLHKYFIAIAIICTVVLALILFFFQDDPPLPPSIAKALQKANRETTGAEGFWPPVKRTFSNRSTILFWNAYGATITIFTVLGTVLNRLYLAHFENGEVEIGNLCFLWTITGMVGGAVFALILDKTKKFRLIFVTLSILTQLFQIMLTICIVMEVKWMVFVSGGTCGFFAVGYYVVGLELCAETTYPEAESVVLGISNFISQIYGAVAVLIIGRMIDNYGDIAGHASMTAFVALGTILTIVNKLDLRRSKAAKAAGYNNVRLQVLKPETTVRRKESWSG